MIWGDKYSDQAPVLHVTWCVHNWRQRWQFFWRPMDLIALVGPLLPVCSQYLGCRKGMWSPLAAILHMPLLREYFQRKSMLGTCGSCRQLVYPPVINWSPHGIFAAPSTRLIWDGSQCRRNNLRLTLRKEAPYMGWWNKNIYSYYELDVILIHHVDDHFPTICVELVYFMQFPGKFT